MDELSSRDLEVEVKYRVSDLPGLLTALARERVSLSDESLQDDQAFAPTAWSEGMSKVGVPFGRLRTESGRHLFTVKKPVSNALACLEYETEISNRTQMQAALIAMGWQPTVRIVKRRRTGTWGGAALCLDQVDGLGAFMELERMVHFSASGEQVQAELDVMVRSLEVPVVRTAETYDSLLRESA